MNLRKALAAGARFSFGYDPPPTGLMGLISDVKALIPKKAEADPKPEAMKAAPGVSPEYAPYDHQHQRISSAVNATLDASGYALVPLNPVHTVEPVLAFASLGTGTGPVPDFRGELLLNAAGEFAFVKVYGQRARTLPEIQPLNGGLIGLLSTLISALNPILASLSKFAPYEAAGGAQVSVVAIRPSVARVSPPYTYP